MMVSRSMGWLMPLSDFDSVSGMTGIILYYYDQRFR
jgi:hypothetical protein